MPVNLSIKNAPDDLVARLKQRAAQNPRSMQGEVMAILSEATREPAPTRVTDIDAIVAKVKAIGLPSASEAVRMIREDRDR